MRKMHTISRLILAAILLASCGRMDDVYQEFLGDGDEIFLAKLEGVEAFSGDRRVKFIIPPQTDPRVKGVHFNWDNGRKSLDCALKNDAPNEIIVEPVSDGSHIFYLQSTDDKGNKSISISLSVSAYGDLFLSSMMPATVTSAARNSTGRCFFQIHHSSVPYYQCLELTYTSASGEEKVVRVPRGTNGLYVEDFKGDSYSYRSVYLPEETSFENLYSETVTSDEILTPMIDAPDEAYLFFARGVTESVTCQYTWETSISVEPDASSWLTASLSGNGVTLKALSRNAGTQPRIGTVTLTSDNISKSIKVIQAPRPARLGTAYGDEGIIFWQNPERPEEYKVISAKGLRRAWSTVATATGATSYTGRTLINGVEYDNNELVKGMPDYRNGNDYAVAWVENLGEGWYMPSINELKDELWTVFNGTVFDESSKTNFNNATEDEKACRTEFEAAMAAIGGMKINMGTNTSSGSSIMTCTEADANTCLGFRMSNPAILTTDKKSVSFYARGVKRVIIND